MGEGGSRDQQGHRCVTQARADVAGSQEVTVQEERAGRGIYPERRAGRTSDRLDAVGLGRETAIREGRSSHHLH